MQWTDANGRTDEWTDELNWCNVTAEHAYGIVNELMLMEHAYGITILHELMNELMDKVNAIVF